MSLTASKSISIPTAPMVVFPTSRGTTKDIISPGLEREKSVGACVPLSTEGKVSDGIHGTVLLAVDRAGMTAGERKTALFKDTL